MEEPSRVPDATDAPGPIEDPAPRTVRTTVERARKRIAGAALLLPVVLYYLWVVDDWESFLVTGGLLLAVSAFLVRELVRPQRSLLAVEAGDVVRRALERGRAPPAEDPGPGTPTERVFRLQEERDRLEAAGDLLGTGPDGVVAWLASAIALLCVVMAVAAIVQGTGPLLPLAFVSGAAVAGLASRSSSRSERERLEALAILDAELSEARAALEMGAHRGGASEE